jgi:prepilin-type N-terminal cleavage/methylation domain-containing protein
VNVPHRRTPQVRSRLGGFSLLELLLALAVLTVAIGLTSSTIVSISGYAVTARENSLARSAVTQMLEELRSGDFDQLFAAYNAVTVDDGPGAPGAAFDVLGLTAQDGDPDGRVGRIELPADPFDGSVLREDLVSEAFGLPADLDLDGVIDGQDHSGDYRMLPVRIVVEWQGETGRSRVTANTVLGPW